MRKLNFRSRTPLRIPASHFYASQSYPATFVAGLKAYLHGSGWLESRRANASIRDGSYVPWITYSATHFLNQVPLSNARVVEFGSGASTIYFLDRARQLTSYEFDPLYFESMKHLIQGEGNQLLGPHDFPPPPEPRDGASVRWTNSPEWREDLRNDPQLQILGVQALAERIQIDIASADVILIDGGPRNLVCRQVATDDGDPLVILDNSDMKYCALGVSALLSSGFHEIQFKSLGPLNPYEWTTSVFVRTLQALSANTT